MEEEKEMTDQLRGIDLSGELGDAIIKTVRAVTKDWYLKRSREEAAKLKLKNG